MDEISKAKRKLSNIDFSVEGSHVALCHKDNPAANNHTTLLWKSQSTAHITQEDVNKAVKTNADVVKVEKAVFVSEIRDKLRRVVEAKFAQRYEWIYLEDFSDESIVFSTDGGLYIVDYRLADDGTYELEDVARGVEYKEVLVENERFKLAEDVMTSLGVREFEMLTKALNNVENFDRLLKAVNDKKRKVENTMDEIQKAVNAANEVKQKEIDALMADLVKSQADVAAFKQKEQEALIKARTEAVAKFDKDGADALVKATAALDADAFALIVKSLELKQKAVDESDLFKQASDPSAVEKQEASATVDTLKAKYPTK